MTADSSSWALLFREGDLLVQREGTAVRLPTSAEALALGLEAAALEVSTSGGLAAWWPEAAALPEGMAFVGLRALHPLLPEPLFALAGRAFQLLEWKRSHRFCGRCGAPTVPEPREGALACSACQTLHFPRLNPAVIVLIQREEKVLLARSPHFKPGVYSTLAGFVEAGESLEQAVAREVREEVGLSVQNIRYFGSQPWPFPNNLMLAFTAEYAGGEVTIDDRELEDAGWFGPEDLPPVPAPLSIGRWMLDDFAQRHGWPEGVLKSPP